VSKGKGGKPSTTGKPSGKGRDNNLPKKWAIYQKPLSSPPFLF